MSQQSLSCNYKMVEVTRTKLASTTLGHYNVELYYIINKTALPSVYSTFVDLIVQHNMICAHDVLHTKKCTNF